MIFLKPCALVLKVVCHVLKMANYIVRFKLFSLRLNFADARRAVFSRRLFFRRKKAREKRRYATITIPPTPTSSPARRSSRETRFETPRTRRARPERTPSSNPPRSDRRRAARTNTAHPRTLCGAAASPTRRTPGRSTTRRRTERTARTPLLVLNTHHSGGFF